ncbi:hypothetical protein DPSP01_003434 [Paraphaeosphaeria sporulosa]|uniref:Uncharacterized protein n=1 Tax=Paraphaeosphaeria sporulosa TaxID=1460663 RepID=A0A177CE56_9PLEO|nr:uncharacterized protein CC84DRAFT_1218474 [Paraphaeosphaeria sporulosa]OAG05089.1 hypothetical protein CC84DRAFT_1218474 [Paraphaeosphaeria sporulosa]
MVKVLLALLLLAIFVTASPAILRGSTSCSGQYRCSYNLSGIETCDMRGWHTAATCKNTTCIVNVGNGIPYCNDP